MVVLEELNFKEFLLLVAGCGSLERTGFLTVSYFGEEDVDGLERTDSVTVSSFGGGCGGLLREKLIFNSFNFQRSVMVVLKELIFNSFYFWEGVVGVGKKLILKQFVLWGRVW